MYVAHKFIQLLLYCVRTWEGRQKGDLHRRITVTSSFFLNLGPEFFAQIVENRRARLSRLFLGHADELLKSYAQDCNKSIDPTAVGAF